MKYYTAEEAAKKLKVSKGHIYELVKRGELKKKEGMGRSIRIPSTELGKVSTERNYFTYNADKIEVIQTHLGSVRKLKNNDLFVCVDIIKSIGIKDSYAVTKAIDRKYVKLLNRNEAKELGIFVNQCGILVVAYSGLVEYSKRSLSPVNWSKFLSELRGVDNQLTINEQISIDEVVEESSKSISVVKNTEHNDIQIFTSSEFGEIKTIMFNKQPWFIGKEVAENLGYIDSKSAIRDHVDSEDKTLILKGQITTLEIPNRGITIINESGLYSLILKSKLPSAKQFKRWVTNEVLPTIRKTGGYVDNSFKFVDNYFSNFSPETRKLLLKELEIKNRTLLVDKDRLDKEILKNRTVIEKIQETL